MGVQAALPQEMRDLRATLQVLGSGHFTAAHVHQVHVNTMKSLGREPMNPIRLGQVLGEYGAIRKPKWDKDKERPNKPKKFPKGYMVKGWVL